MKIETLTGIAIWATAALALPGNIIKDRQIKTFNAKEQFISTSGKHKFVPPGPGDQRGPCPGLNAMANHGYLPHNGVGTIADFTNAPFEVFGLGPDVGGAVAVFGAIMCGDGLTWSIGGPPALGLTGHAPNLLGRPTGISFSHNTYEGDASATRPDLYVAGNDYKVDMKYWKQLYNTLPATSFKTLSAHRNKRVQQSVATNPYFFSGPFTGIVVSGGANSFVYRLASNHSAEHPEGIMTKEIFKTMWSIREDKNGKLYWKPGWDRIPDNWYRRPLIDNYNIPFLAADLAEYFAQHPETVKVGGNMGKVNTFTGLDLTNATGGVFNAEDFAKGNTAACFAFQAATLIAPDALSKIFKDISGPMALLEKTFSKALAPLNCPQLKTFDRKALDRYPGYSKLKSDGTYNN